MSKRYTGEEWSDDDFDGKSLSGSPPKKHKNSVEFESESSSRKGFFSRAINTITSSVKNLFSPNPEEQRMNCESVRSHSLGMNQNSNVYSLEMRSNQPMLPSSHILTRISNQSSNYVIIHHNPSPQPSAQITYNVIHAVPIYQANANPEANLSPTPLVLLPTPSTQDMDPTLKCHNCGQVSSSPVTKCRHCRNPKSNTESNTSAIPESKFYSTQNNSCLGRGRARMQMSSASATGETPNKTNISVRSLTGALNINDNRPASNQHLKQFCPQFISKQPKNPEIIELDEENGEKMKITQDSDGFEILDSKQNKSIVSGIGVQCDIQSETNNSKIKPFEQNKSSVINNNNSQEFMKDLQSFADYAMFGTYKTILKSVEFMSDGIKLMNVSPNSKETKFKYHIMIPFVEMQELFFSSSDTNSYLLIKPTSESNSKIQDSMYLGVKSPNGLKFDITSKDKREHYIIIVLKERMGERFSQTLKKVSRLKNDGLECGSIDLMNANRLLESAKTRPSIQTIPYTNRSNQSILQTTPKRNNIFSVNKNSNLFKGSDSSDTSPSPSKSSYISRRSYPRTPMQTIIIDIDDDEEDILETKNGSESEFDKVIFSYPENDKNAIHLVGTDIKCLNKGEFLNDNIVNFYLRYYFIEKLDEDSRKRTHIFDTLFFMQLTEKRPPKRKNSFDEQYTFTNRYQQKLKKWTKNLDLFSKDFLVLPIIKESHWFLAIVCYPSAVYELQQKTDQNSPKIKSQDSEEVLEKFSHFDKKPCIIFMDSLGNGANKKTLTKHIRDFLQHEWKERNKEAEELSFYGAKAMRDISPHVPNQTNSSDCGLFVLEYVEQFLMSPDQLIKDLYHNKHSLIEWFDSNSVKTKRQQIRELVLSKVSPELRDRLETLIDDTKLSDCEDCEIGMEVMNTSVDESKSSSPEEEVF